MSYADLAARMELSEPTVKRIFAAADCKLSRLTEICAALEIPLDDVLEAARHPRDDLRELTVGAERALADRPILFHLLLLLRDGLDQVAAASRLGLDEAGLFRAGFELDRLGVAELRSDGAIDVNSARAIRFRRDGPLNPLLRTINQRFLSDILARAEAPDTAFVVASRRMRRDTARRIRQELEDLRQRIGTLAKRDQLTAQDEELETYKLTCAWGQVDFSELLSQEREAAGNPMPYPPP
ncbi:hypothetical protein Salmuc_00350 [Salipiger mucosus DSM 16094]|uniref:HTH cro/C1-type domain-containing protein n=2 Tax=Salipiger mucosus TaxID=263378 RepID=S9RR50_9RHOB|nr:hypothetical protein Salmuc_00350 [Salipiger mucosus DSM 16094]